MANFAYQQHQSNIIDQTVYVSNSRTAASCFPQFQQPFHGDSNFHGYNHDQVSVANMLQSSDSSMSMNLDDKKVENHVGNEFLEEKGNDRQIMPLLNQAQSYKDTSNTLKKQKKTSVYQVEKRKKYIKKVCSSQGEGAVGYVHVRARRGQATDNHSLAERARREKISERMKFLQDLVPGCDKVTGKAPMLDEIINYVQSLQNQVEFLSMKLATVNPMLYNFGVDLDALMHKPDENMRSMVLPIMPSVQHCTPHGGAATFAPADDNYNHLSQLIIEESQMQIILSQGNGYRMWDIVDENRTMVLL